MKSKIFSGSADQGQHRVSLPAGEKRQPGWSVCSPEEEQRLPHVAGSQTSPSAVFLQTVQVGQQHSQLVASFSKFLNTRLYSPPEGEVG